MSSICSKNRNVVLAEADQFSGADISRQTLIERFRQRINTGTRTRLSIDEFALLATSFVDRLKSLTAQAEIRQACAEEIALLEEGYSQASIASRYLPIYRKLIKDA
jgi:benzoyl-CoA reductase/2-hydroxyglutaryl-CoA dehydratase subunit BcrC/BadD/HgdB